MSNENKEVYNDLSVEEKAAGNEWIEKYEVDPVTGEGFREANESNVLVLELFSKDRDVLQSTLGDDDTDVDTVNTKIKAISEYIENSLEVNIKSSEYAKRNIIDSFMERITSEYDKMCNEGNDDKAIAHVYDILTNEYKLTDISEYNKAIEHVYVDDERDVRKYNIRDILFMAIAYKCTLAIRDLPE